MKAMVLAAGFGTRLGELTREIPKPMLPIEGRPMLEYVIEQLRRHGFDDLVVNLHYRPEMIRSHFGDGRRWGVRLTWSYEETLLGTAGGLKNVASFFDGERDYRWSGALSGSANGWPRRDPAEALIELALHSGADITPLEGRSRSLLTESDGIAAVLRA